jgi:hypothetical protein
METMGVLTRWELMLPGRFEEFYCELIDYLRLHLLQIPRCPDAPDAEKLWVCPAVYQKTIKGCGDTDYGWAHYLKRFCEVRRLIWIEVLAMIEERVGQTISCDCHIIEAEEFRVGMPLNSGGAKFCRR